MHSTSTLHLSFYLSVLVLIPWNLKEQDRSGCEDFVTDSAVKQNVGHLVNPEIQIKKQITLFMNMPHAIFGT